ncbi:MAG: BglII/BstYI family type II restriction endonuclease [Patescibacteria group bacterium]
MTTTQLIPDDIKNKYEIHEWRNATAVLVNACPSEWKDILEVLKNFKLLRSSVLIPGGRKSTVSGALDTELYKKGWIERSFDTQIIVDGKATDSPTHKVDCFKNRVALEVEWNNKDPFFDRDLNNFRLLFDLRVIDLGVIITRCDDLQKIFDKLERGHSFGPSTTHMGKLIPRIEGGGGGGCPILVFGISKVIYVEDEIPSQVPEEIPEDADIEEKHE